VRREVDVPVLRFGEQGRTAKERDKRFANGGCIRYTKGGVTFVEDWGGFAREVEAEKRSLLDLLTFREHASTMVTKAVGGYETSRRNTH